MKIEVSTVKGFQDFLPPDSLKRAEVKRIIEKNFRLYGFLPIETPMIEFDELMKSDTIPGDEDEAVSDRFRLKDRAGRNLGLRYEFTFQLARIFKMNPNIKLPFKRYQIGEVFRDEPTSTNRFKQFTQCDADIIGDSSTEAEAECLSIVSEILKELKIEADININSRKLLNAIIESTEMKFPEKIMRELDKRDKIGEDEVKLNLKKYGDTNQVITLFKLLEKPLDFFIENAFEGARELKDLQDLSIQYGVKTKFNPFMIRGLGYYTGTIFEVVGKEKGSIASGGRYDKLVGKFASRELPAFGISFGLERVTSLADIEYQTTKTVLISLDKEKETIKLSRKLRKEGISCLTFFTKAGKALEYADSQKIHYAVFIGQNEIDKGKFKVKDLDSGTEEELTEKQLIKKLK